MAAADAAVAGLSYEQARDELVSVVAKLESGGESLADSMALFQRGEALVRLCEEQLTAARQVITGAPTPDQARSN
ncbi:MAG: exodeoxyribonuclease VII small subunit [Propionibacteriaceae bacterium]|nr:exodeoxyribonuclease VII small subunit [Propionibacteriaceae bacterium]